jgi:hypothetical protein
LIYTGFLSGSPRNKVDVVYQQFFSGSKERQLIMALAEIEFQERPELLRKIKGLYTKTTELSTLRNAMTHGVYMFDHLNGPPSLRISPGGDTTRMKNKLSESGNELKEELENIFDDLYSLEKELEAFRQIMINENS